MTDAEDNESNRQDEAWAEHRLTKYETGALTPRPIEPASEDPDAAWHAWRSQGIGASDLARAATGSYGGTYAVVAQKRGLLPEQETTAQMNRGHRWEQPIADAVHALTGLYVVGEQMWCEWQTNPKVRATIDGMLAHEPETSIDDVIANLEIKTVGVGVKWNRDYWQAQIQTQMLVTGLTQTCLAIAVIDDTTDQIVRIQLEWIEADTFQQSLLIDLANNILDHIDNETLPDPDTGSALETVKLVTANARPEAPTVELDDITDELAEYGRTKQAVKDVTGRLNELEALIKHRLGEHTKGEADGWRVSFSKNSMVVPPDQAEALLEAHPEIGKTVLDRDLAKTYCPDEYEAARRPIGARRMTIKQLETS